jgi:hypothetical protein
MTVKFSNKFQIEKFFLIFFFEAQHKSIPTATDQHGDNNSKLLLNEMNASVFFQPFMDE